MIQFLAPERTRGSVRLRFVAGKRLRRFGREASERERQLNNLFRCEASEHVTSLQRLQKDSQNWVKTRSGNLTFKLNCMLKE